MKKVNYFDITGMWLIALFLSTVMLGMWLIDPWSIVITMVGLFTLFGVPWIFVRMWNAVVDRKSRQHYHED